MTDKEQIIIDGVDVKNCKGIDLGLFPLAKCKFLKFKTSDGGIAGIWCSDHTNCYYKQLARKTQECEELKKENELLESQMAFNLSEMEIRLGNEVNRNETLSKELKRFDKIKDEFREMSEQLKTKNDRYRKALEEIEEYCDKQISLTGDLPFRTTESDILDIINKAKGKNEQRE